ncbi:MAG: AAA ATPase domain [Phormidium sp. OSCR]|nr:MAG: AAA ATPase domain [Phormidium sp. OSCR]
MDYIEFFNCINPSKTLIISQEDDRQYYIDFTSVRGYDSISKLKHRIAVLRREQPSCSLFTGHIGCGKSTELHRLQAELEAERFCVVNFESDEDIDTADVDIVDVFLTIAKRVSAKLEEIAVPEATGLRRLIQRTQEVLTTEIDVKASLGTSTLKGELDSQKNSVSLSAGIASLTVRAKNDSRIREKLSQYLGPKVTGLLATLNEELIQPGIESLKNQGYAGLVVIVDNLDRIDNRPKPSGRSQQEYLFVERGELLTKLACHIIYTMPLGLRFSNEFGNLTQRFPDKPECLPMVSIRHRNGEDCPEGLAKLKQMVLARAFPQLTEAERLERIGEIFETPAVFDRLCRVTGGHVRDLLQLLSQWVEEEMQLPLTEATLEEAICDRCNEMTLAISPREWELLREVRQTQKVQDQVGYENLIRSRMVFEYQERRQSWFDVNPILLEAAEMNDS